MLADQHQVRLQTLLVHASSCQTTNCQEDASCKHMKQMFLHIEHCRKRECVICRDVLRLVRIHHSQCADDDCMILNCRLIRSVTPKHLAVTTNEAAVCIELPTSPTKPPPSHATQQNRNNFVDAAAAYVGIKEPVLSGQPTFIKLPKKKPDANENLKKVKYQKNRKAVSAQLTKYDNKIKILHEKSLRRQDTHSDSETGSISSVKSLRRCITEMIQGDVDSLDNDDNSCNPRTKLHRSDSYQSDSSTSRLSPLHLTNKSNNEDSETEDCYSEVVGFSNEVESALDGLYINYPTITSDLLRQHLQQAANKRSPVNKSIDTSHTLQPRHDYEPQHQLSHDINLTFTNGEDACVTFTTFTGFSILTEEEMILNGETTTDGAVRKSSKHAQAGSELANIFEEEEDVFMFLSE